MSHCKVTSKLRRRAAVKLLGVLLGVLLAGHGLLHPWFHCCGHGDGKSAIAERIADAGTRKLSAAAPNDLTTAVETECPFCSAALDWDAPASPEAPGFTLSPTVAPPPEYRFHPAAATALYLSRAPPFSA